MDKYLCKIKEVMKPKIKLIKDFRLLVVLGFIGMILILISELIPDDNSEEDSSKAVYGSSEYAEYMEREVEKILGKIDGVGDVSVMLTFEGTEEYIYAQESKESETSGSDSSSSQIEKNFIFEQKDGDRKALVKKKINPSVTGVVVVCDGGNNSAVKEKIYEAVSVSLDIPLNRICVQGT